MENKRKRYSLAVLFAIMLCFVSCVFNVHAEKYSPTDAGEVIIYKSFETGEARYINYTKKLLHNFRYTALPGCLLWCQP